MIDRLIEQMVQGCRLLSVGGHDDFNQGQISSRIDADSFVIKNAMVGFNDATPEAFCVCPIDDQQPLPKDAPPETPLHQAVYAARANVSSVVHSHPQSSIVFGATDLELKPISHEGTFFFENIARFDESTNTILDISSAEAVARALGPRNALFLCNHGIVIASKTIRLSVILALMLERACKIQLEAEKLGVPFRVTSPDEVLEKANYIYSDVAIRSYWKHATKELAQADKTLTRVV